MTTKTLSCHELLVDISILCQRFSELTMKQLTAAHPLLHFLLTRLISGRFKTVFSPAQIGTFWSEKENQHNSPGALSCKGEQGCSGDYRGPAGGEDGAGDPAFCDPVDDRNWLDPCIGPGQQQGQRWRRQQLNWAVRSEKTTVPWYVQNWTRQCHTLSACWFWAINIDRTINFWWKSVKQR